MERIIYTLDWQSASLEDFIGKAGVWFLSGRPKGQKERCVLQVAQTKDMFAELSRDLAYMTDVDIITEERYYINQFGEMLFAYTDLIDGRQRALYQQIDQHYEEFRCYAFALPLAEQFLRKSLEKYIAYKTAARYWVNGRPYQSGQSQQRVTRIKQASLTEADGLPVDWSLIDRQALDALLEKEGK